MTVYMHGRMHVAYACVFEKDRFKFRDEIPFKEGRSVRPEKFQFLK